MPTTRLLVIFFTFSFIICNIPLWWRSTGAFQTELAHDQIASTFAHHYTDVLNGSATAAAQQQTNVVYNEKNLPVHMVIHHIGHTQQWITQHIRNQFRDMNQVLYDDFKKQNIPLFLSAQKHTLLRETEIDFWREHCLLKKERVVHPSETTLVGEECKEQDNLDQMAIMDQFLREHFVVNSYEEKPGLFTLFIVEQGVLKTHDGDNKDDNVKECATLLLQPNHLYLGTGRHGWLTIPSNDYMSTEQLKETIQQVYRLITMKDLTMNRDLQIKTSANQYILSFTLINQEPSHINYVWNFEEMEQKYLQPFLSKISPLLLTNVSVDSQILQYANLPSTPVFNPHRERYELKSNEMQLLLNENSDWKLDSYAFNDPTVHFILLVPDTEYSPLFVVPHDTQSSRSKLKSITSNEMADDADDAYVIPRWGGVVILNSSPTDDKNSTTSQSVNRVLSEAQEAYVMQSFISQMRMLLALPTYTPVVQVGNFTVHMVPDTKHGIADWEIDQLMRDRIEQNLATAKHSLESLSTVVSNMPNVLVMHRIAELTNEALNHTQQAYTLISNIGPKNSMVDYEKLLQHSKIAMEKSERAFFHPSMISMLHFPDSQKLAIYLPLLLPVGVTILTATLRELRYLRRARQESR